MRTPLPRRTPWTSGLVALCCALGVASPAGAGPSLGPDYGFDVFPLTQRLWRSREVEAEPAIRVIRASERGHVLHWAAEFPIRVLESDETDVKRVQGELRLDRVPELCESVDYPPIVWGIDGFVVGVPYVSSDQLTFASARERGEHDSLSEGGAERSSHFCSYLRKVQCLGVGPVQPARTREELVEQRRAVECAEGLSRCDQADAAQQELLGQLLPAMPEPEGGWQPDRPKRASCSVSVVATILSEDSIELRAVDVNGAVWGSTRIVRPDRGLALGWKVLATPVAAVGDTGIMAVEVAWNAVVFTAYLPLMLVMLPMAASY